MLGLRINSLKKNKANNKGMALITVIVAIGFIAALVSILLMTTMVNFKMKNVNSKGKDTFYSAEQVLDEINIGLQRVVSDCMSEAYLDIMNNYASYDSRTKTEMLTTMYYEKLWERLEVTDSHHAQYDVSILESYLKESTKWHDDSVFGESAEGGGYGAIISAYDDTTHTDSNAGKMITYLNDGIVLKDLRVYYKDEKGFVSVIQTDIRLAYPQFDFAASSELPNIPYYCIIADGGAVVSSTNKVDLSGNLYANNLEFTGPTTEGAKTKIVTGDDDLMIVKYNLDLKNSYFNYNADPSAEETGKDTVLWANNIILNSSNAKVNGTIQLKNDLNIKGANSYVKLTGEYVGFGTGATPGSSSSIVVNGTESTIDMSKLSRITIGGRAYASTNKSTYDNQIDSTVVKTKNDDILMGESLAVKSNQLYYLVPACAIGVDEETGRSLYNKNPLTSTEYQQIKLLAKTSKNDTNHHYLEVSDEVEVPSLGTTLAPYIDYELNGGLPKAEKIFVRTSNNESLVYYYMAFNSEQTANTFFATYYAQNKESVDRYMDFYLNEVKIPDETNLVTFRTVGNMIKGKASDEDGFDRVSANTSTSVMGAGSLVSDMMEYDKKFNQLCTRLLTSSTSAAGASCPRGETYEEDIKADQVVFENIVANTVGDDRLKQFIDENPAVAGTPYEYNNVTFTKNTSKKVTLSAEGFDRVIICNDETDTIVINTKETGKETSPIKLVITKGNVKIDGVDFDGLILCDGKLEVSGTDNVIHSNPSEVRKCLQYGYVDPATSDVITVAYTLKDGDEYIYSSLDAKGNTANLALGGLISYENWKKE